MNDVKKKPTLAVRTADQNLIPINDASGAFRIGRDEDFHSVILGNISGTVLSVVITLYVEPP